MIVDGDFSKNRVFRLFESLAASIIAGPLLSKFLPKVAIKFALAKLAKWLNEGINSLLNALGVSRVEEEVHFLGDQVRLQNPSKPSKPVVPVLKQG